MMLIWLFSCCYRSTKKAVCSAGRMVGGGGSNSSKIFRGETDGKEKNFILIFSSPTQKQTVILRHFSYYSTSFSCLFSLISSSNKLLQSQKSFLTYFVFSSSCRLSQQYTAKQHFLKHYSVTSSTKTHHWFFKCFFSFTTRWVIFRDWGNEGGYFVVIVYHFLLKKCKKSSFSASFLLISTGQLVILGGQLIFSFTLVFFSLSKAIILCFFSILHNSFYFIQYVVIFATYIFMTYITHCIHILIH